MGVTTSRNNIFAKLYRLAVMILVFGSSSIPVVANLNWTDWNLSALCWSYSAMLRQGHSSVFTWLATVWCEPPFAPVVIYTKTFCFIFWVRLCDSDHQHQICPPTHCFEQKYIPHIPGTFISALTQRPTCLAAECQSPVCLPAGVLRFLNWRSSLLYTCDLISAFC